MPAYVAERRAAGCDNPFKGGSDVFAGGSVDLLEEPLPCKSADDDRDFFFRGGVDRSSAQRRCLSATD